MPGRLRQATAAQSRALGPFVSDSDFKTVQTGLTIAATDIKLIVNGGASANKNLGGGTHRVNGVYGVTFDATDTATVGELQVSVLVTGALVVFDKFTVVEEIEFDQHEAAGTTGIATAIENADALLNRDMSLGTDSGSSTVRTPRNALRVLRNKVSSAIGVQTVTKEDDTTTAWTAALTTDAAGVPIIGIDPQ